MEPIDGYFVNAYMVEHDAAGKPLGVVNAPVPEGVIEAYEALGRMVALFEGQRPPDDFLRLWWFDRAEDELKERPALDLPDEVTITTAESYKFSGLPMPCKLRVNDSDAEVPDGELVIKSAIPALFNVRFMPFPYLFKTVKVTVNAA
jgi:hypothetical protein